MAALTIPGLVIKNQEKETVVRLKKVYNILCNAFSLAVIDYGSPDNWGLEKNDEASNIKLANIFAKYMNVLKNCGSGEGCYTNEKYKGMDGTLGDSPNKTPKIGKLLLADSTSMYFWVQDKDCNYASGLTTNLQRTCATLSVDINGFKKPNRIGYDNFQFYITKYAIVPMGIKDNTANNVTRCHMWGYNCTAWVLLKENMDYLKGPVNWD